MFFFYYLYSSLVLLVCFSEYLFVWFSFVFLYGFLVYFCMVLCVFCIVLSVVCMVFSVYFVWFLVCLVCFSFVNFFFCVIPVESQRNAPCGPLGLGRCDDRCADFLPERRCRSGGRDCTDGYHTWCCIHRDDWTELCDANWYITRYSFLHSISMFQILNAFSKQLTTVHF